MTHTFSSPVLLHRGQGEVGGGVSPLCPCMLGAPAAQSSSAAASLVLAAELTFAETLLS